MGKDVQDWQRQITVNTDIVVPVKLDIAGQTLTRVRVTPDEIYERYTLERKAYTSVNIPAGTRVTIHTESVIGAGIIIQSRASHSKLATKFEADSVMILNENPSGIWNTQGGWLPVVNKGVRLLIFDSINAIFTMSMDFSWFINIAAEFKVYVENTEGSDYILNRIDIFWLKEI